jgi:alpha-beta hydrolase superfamily lysophospholipase
LVADVYSPNDQNQHPVVLLLHMLARTHADYQPLLEPLINAGFVVVNIDLRGHGTSLNCGNKRLDYKTFTDQDWAQLPKDADWVLKKLKGTKGVDSSKLCIVGASIGANAAIMAAAQNADVKGVVALSPGLTFHNLQPKAALANYHKPLLLVAAADDKYSLDTVAQLHAADAATSETVLYPVGGHGTQMLTTHPQLNAKIADWLSKAVSK